MPSRHWKKRLLSIFPKGKRNKKIKQQAGNVDGHQLNEQGHLLIVAPGDRLDISLPNGRREFIGKHIRFLPKVDLIRNTKRNCRTIISTQE